MPATARASKTRTALLAAIIAIWGITFAAVGIGSDGVTALCIGGEAPPPVAGYTWAQDHTNDCAWTLYSGSVFLRNEAPDSAYTAQGLTPPERAPILHDWQMIMILIATGVTASLGLWRARLGDREADTVAMVAASADAS